jgi:hypothetical protein
MDEEWIRLKKEQPKIWIEWRVPQEELVVKLKPWNEHEFKWALQTSSKSLKRLVVWMDDTQIRFPFHELSACLSLEIVMYSSFGPIKQILLDHVPKTIWGLCVDEFVGESLPTFPNLKAFGCRSEYFDHARKSVVEQFVEHHRHSLQLLDITSEDRNNADVGLVEVFGIPHELHHVFLSKAMLSASAIASLACVAKTKFGEVRTLSIQSTYQGWGYDTTGLNSVLCCCPKLESIHEVSGNTCHTKMLELTTTTLRSVRFNSSVSIENIIWLLNHHCTTLEVLDVYTRIASKHLEELVTAIKQCTRLKRLHLGWRHITTSAMEQVLRACPPLQHLTLSNDPYQFIDFHRIDLSEMEYVQGVSIDSIAWALPERAPKLKTLHCSVVGLNDEHARQLRPHLTHITDAHVDGSAITIENMFSESLEFLHCSERIERTNAARLVRRFPNLKELKISIHDVDNELLSAIVDRRVELVNPLPEFEARILLLVCLTTFCSSFFVSDRNGTTPLRRFLARDGDRAIVTKLHRWLIS